MLGTAMQALDAYAGPASFLTPLGYQSSSCGYCKNEDTSAAYYANTKELNVEHYQALVDRGWRRSGTLLYKPDVLRACCPHYTIRLPTVEFHPARDQRQAVSRWNKFVLGEPYISEAKKRYPKSKEDKTRQRNTFDLFEAVHEAEYSNLKRPPEPAHRFEVTLEPDNFTEEKFQLFSNYQQAVHHDKPEEVTRKGFTRFLCDSPLRHHRSDKDSTAAKLGSFHQCYRLDGRLIAIAVLDLLPHAVSGVYFIYHSDFEKYSFGKISALREAALAEELGLEYYYMGFYIHNCRKMRYKGDYRPQYVLDPESYEWAVLDDELRALMDEKKYVSMARENKLKKRQTDVAGGDTPMRGAEATDVEEEWKFSSSPARAAQAADEGVSILDLGMPGVPSPSELLEKFDLDNIQMAVPQAGLIVKMTDLVAWEQGAVTDKRSLKGHISELVACVGPEVAGEMVVKLTI
ncbi:uncharacterized protein K452DRAFT_318885 [Aplosporella prunicola CBS 121167]|uniref:Arginyl-tRNA--protein transferase 1 n=1 Tax=Aplosporella prunicola CBS 121167 TaxID=1176127 RepID=A0A6A6BAE9_9PEZI|nr:uncharacterized protein K452DRAFT_318885 [Aplosporella prunicola CBS 121167]KAF2141222.1 hypothetical protein K452DRAFT_318885 [Aplosporella prunicola CBS 121167]